ncbi:MAG: PfkB family carbohydrate kinase [Bifidobacteriaceae bacterium]|jgi:ribokinase|nr:PfkB family carbohydrate kinase [Bifidobacteriaceae bacterium]
MTPTALLCIGNITVDDAVLPDGTRRDACLGGDVIYAGLAARLFEPEVRLLAPLGSDLPPAAAQALERAGLGVAGFLPRDRSNVRNTVTYLTDGSRVWDLWYGEEHFAAMSVWPSDLDADAVAAPAVLFLAMALEPQLACVQALPGGGERTTYLDLQEDYIYGHLAEVAEMVRLCDVFLPSEEEVFRLLGHRDLAAAARELAGWGPSVVVIKRAGAGSLVYQRADDSLTEVAAWPAAVVDSTGAGDAFCGAFAAVHHRTGDAVQAARAGAVAASYAIGGFGVEAMTGLTRQQVDVDLEEWGRTDG